METQLMGPLRWPFVAVLLGLLVLEAGTPLMPAAASEPDRPEITSIAPDHGPRAGGNSVVIEGENFSEATTVRFGFREAESFTVDSDTQITAIAPPSGGAGEWLAVVDVYVLNADGEGISPELRYGYAPVINQIEPHRGPPSGGTAVRLHGYGLEETSAVYFGSLPAQSFTVNPDGSLTAIAPPSISPDPMVPITATTPEGTTEDFHRQEVYPANDFIYGPTVESVSPSEGPQASGTTVTIHGSGFESARWRCFCAGTFLSSISFGPQSLDCGYPWTTAGARCFPLRYQVISDTTILAVTPPGSGTVEVGVGTAGGDSTLNPAASFTYTPDRAPPESKPEEWETILRLSCARAGRFLRSTGVSWACSSQTSTQPASSLVAEGPLQTKARLYRGRALVAKGFGRVGEAHARFVLRLRHRTPAGRYELAIGRLRMGSAPQVVMVR
jgi:IPT/TIG domain-containing protein